MGFRTEGVFVGDHNRITGEPIPEHISARHQDSELLLNGLTNTYQLLETGGFEPVLAATNIAFGFVFIHPFSDCNGRIHRYLIHLILAKLNLTHQGVIFPISASILDKIYLKMIFRILPLQQKAGIFFMAQLIKTNL